MSQTIQWYYNIENNLCSTERKVLEFGLRVPEWLYELGVAWGANCRQSYDRVEGGLTARLG